MKWQLAWDAFKFTSPCCRIYASVIRDSRGWDIGLSPIWHQAVILTNASLLSIWPLGTKFSEILIKIKNFHSQICIAKYRVWNCGHFVQGDIHELMFCFQHGFSANVLHARVSNSAPLHNYWQDMSSYQKKHAGNVSIQPDKTRCRQVNTIF